MLRAFGAAALVGATVLAAGCGGTTSSNQSGSPAAAGISTAPPPTPTACETKGGTLKILSAGDVDHIDAGQAYYAFSYEITRPTQRSLLNDKPGTVQLQPDLAAAMPQVSKDGKTVTVELRQGVRFSPPVDRAVTSADVKYAIERGFATSVANGYAAAYFGVPRRRRSSRSPSPGSRLRTRARSSST